MLRAEGREQGIVVLIQRRLSLGTANLD